jgi:ABC-type branched-subunit amino acid transport system substrate-binding protein
MKTGARRRSLALGVVVAAIVAVSAGCSTAASSGSNAGSGSTSGSSASGAATGSPIVIGQEVCETGYLSATDLYLVSGAQIEVNQLNQAGGILGHKVVLQSVDTQCVASNEIQLAESLIEKSHASAIIGGYQSAAISGVLPIVKQDKIPFVAAGTLPVQTPWGVTTFPPNSDPGAAFLSYAVSKLGAKTIGNISGDTPYGTALQAQVTTEAKALGATTRNVELSNTATTTTPVLEQVSGTDAIFTNTSGPINIIMAKDAATLGLKIPLIFDDPADCPQIAAAYQPVYCLIPQAQLYPNVANPTIKANDGVLWTAYKATGGKMLNFPSITVGADQVELIAQAMEKAKSTDGSAANTALASLDYVGAQGEYKFKPGYSFGSTNPYVLASTANNTDTVVYQPTAGAAS